MTKQNQVPDPETFMIPILAAQLEALKELEAMAPLLSETLQYQIRKVSDEVYQILEKRGKQYGEDVIFLTGEAGMLILVVHKALRMLWSYQQGHPAESRVDSWLDLNGYATLQRAMDKWREISPEERRPALDESLAYHWLTMKDQPPLFRLDPENQEDAKDGGHPATRKDTP